MKRVLIVGKSGLLGTKVHERFIDSFLVGGVSKSGKGRNNKALDITDRDTVTTFFDQYSFDAVVHLAAITDVDYCERNPDDAWETNVEGTKNLVLECKRRDIKLVYFSSDYIYDGDHPPYSDTDNPNPVNEYGTTKLEGERVIKEELYDYVIIRPGKLYGYSHEFGVDPFTAWVRMELSESGSVVADDTVLKYPTLIDDMARLINSTLEDDWTGVLNVSCASGTTKYEWAKRIAETYSFDPDRVTAEPANPFGDRPMDVEYVRETIRNREFSPNPLTEGLDMMVRQEYCTFRPIYRMDIADEFHGEPSGEIRTRLGRCLAETDDIDPDVVVPIPESGTYPAAGYAASHDRPLRFGLSKHQFRKRTLYDQAIDRDEVLDDTMRVIEPAIEGQKVALVDEAILTGSTLSAIVPKLDAAAEIHVRISSPPVRTSCPAQMHPKDIVLYTSRLDLDDCDGMAEIETAITTDLGVDSVRFLTESTFLSEFRSADEMSCTFCFHDGH